MLYCAIGSPRDNWQPPTPSGHKGESLKSQLYRYTTTAVLLLISVLGLVSCNREPVQNRIVYGLTLSPTGIDPHINASAELGIPLSSVYDMLIFQDPETGDFVPGLAESWTISGDGLVYKFTLREDVTFHDGTKFNAQAVKDNLEYVIDPAHLSQKASFMLGTFERAEVLDEYTVAIHLSAPFAPLLDSLSQVYLGMASPKALEEWGPAEYQFHQVGTGPYRFIEYIPNDHITLQKYADYAWAPSIYTQTQAEIEEIVFRFYEDEATRSLALESGEVDVIWEIPPHEAERLGESAEFVLHPIPIPGQPTQFFFNTNREPTNDVKLREALIYALDRDSIVNTVFGKSSPVGEGPLSHKLFEYTTGFPYPPYDAGMASDLLDQLGWEMDTTSSKRYKNGVPLELDFIVPSWGSNPEVGQLISAAWERLGIKVSLEVSPGFGPLREAKDAGEYNLIGINFFGTDADLLRSFFASDGFYNWSGYQDLRLDQLLADALEDTHDQQARYQYYSQIAEIIRNQVLIIPIRDYVNLVVARSDLEGLHFSPQGWFPYLIDLHRTP
jgi:peptide/nickel transport system substrate-binding protein